MVTEKVENAIKIRIRGLGLSARKEVKGLIEKVTFMKRVREMKKYPIEVPKGNTLTA